MRIDRIELRVMKWIWCIGLNRASAHTFTHLHTCTLTHHKPAEASVMQLWQNCGFKTVQCKHTHTHTVGLTPHSTGAAVTLKHFCRVCRFPNPPKPSLQTQSLTPRWNDSRVSPPYLPASGINTIKPQLTGLLTHKNTLTRTHTHLGTFPSICVLQV